MHPRSRLICPTMHPLEGLRRVQCHQCTSEGEYQQPIHTTREDASYGSSAVPSSHLEPTKKSDSVNITQHEPCPPTEKDRRPAYTSALVVGSGAALLAPAPMPPLLLLLAPERLPLTHASLPNTIGRPNAAAAYPSGVPSIIYLHGNLQVSAGFPLTLSRSTLTTASVVGSTTCNSAVEGVGVKNT
jgi:hypothetical protein